MAACNPHEGEFRWSDNGQCERGGGSSVHILVVGAPLVDERLLQAVHRRMLMDGDALGAVRERGDVHLEHECIDRVADDRLLVHV